VVDLSTWPLIVLTCQASAGFGARTIRAFLSGKKFKFLGDQQKKFFTSFTLSTSHVAIMAKIKKKGMS
jgi:hypothetical protein